MALKFTVLIFLVLALHCSLYCSQLTDADGNGPLWQDKVARFFDVLDMDANGLQTSNDIEVFAYRYKILGHLTTAQQGVILTTMDNVWQTIFAKAPKNAPPTVRVYIDVLSNMGQAGLTAAAGIMFPSFFNFIDINSDKVIEIEEYELLFSVLGLNPTTSVEAFMTLDTDGNGLMSQDEFLLGGVDYFSTDNPQSIYNTLLGPLI